MTQGRILRFVGILKRAISPRIIRADQKISYFNYRNQLSSVKAAPETQIKTYYTLLATFAFWTAVLNYKKNTSPVFAMSLTKRKAEEEKKVDDATIVLLRKADQLYEELKFEELYNMLLEYKDDKNEEILWRLARSIYRVSKSTESKEKKKEILTQANEIIFRALEINETNFACHKWAAILVVELAECFGNKQKLLQSYVSKKHMVRAHELNPKDGTTLYLLGVWCYTFADLSWAKRKAASLIFATPPTSSYYEAQTYFLKAEEVDPNFYTMNLVMLAKTFMKMDDKPRAIEYLKQAYVRPQKTEDDKQAYREAKELLTELGVKY